MAYMSGSATSALSCVSVIEHFYLAVYTVDSHICFLLLTVAHSIEDMDGPHSFNRTAGGKHAMFKQTIYFVQKTCCQIDYIYLIFSVRIQTS
jgi:hypothetical protein